MSEGSSMPTTSRAVCVFCDIVAGQGAASVVYEDDLVLAFMDNFPINPGHTLVVPKMHYASLSDLPEMVGAHLFTIGQRLAAVLRQSQVRREGVNLFLSDGEAAGQEVFHCHLHILPRFGGDSFHVEHDPSMRLSREEIDAVAQHISGIYSKVFPTIRVPAQCSCGACRPGLGAD